MDLFKKFSTDRINENDFLVWIEIEKDGKNKYEVDKETGMLYLDRVLYTSTHYPANYGFIPCTLSPDGDPLDVFVFSTQSIVPNSLVRCYAIGYIEMLDNGKGDYKILAIPFSDPQFNSIKDVKDMPKHLLDELHHFLTVYKELEPNKKTIVDKINDNKMAKKIIVSSIEAYKLSNIND